MSIFSTIFGSSQQAAPAQAPQQQQTQVQPGNLQDPAAVAAQSQPAAPNTPPAAGSASLTTTNPDSPLAAYEKMWEAKQAGTDGTQPPANPAALNLTPEAISKIVGQTNFAQSLDPQVLAAISAGGEGAEQALTTALNSVAQQVFTQATLVNSKLAEKQIQAALAAEIAKLPSAMRNQSVSDHMANTNPLFNNPAIKPVADAAREQLLQLHPHASQAEITSMVEKYIVAMGQQFAPPVDPQQQQAAKEYDWSTYLQQM